MKPLLSTSKLEANLKNLIAHQGWWWKRVPWPILKTPRHCSPNEHFINVTLALLTWQHDAKIATSNRLLNFRTRWRICECVNKMNNMVKNKIDLSCEIVLTQNF